MSINRFLVVLSLSALLITLNLSHLTHPRPVQAMDFMISPQTTPAEEKALRTLLLNFPESPYGALFPARGDFFPFMVRDAETLRKFAPLTRRLEARLHLGKGK